MDITGKGAQTVKFCGNNGCDKNHHRLLHRSDRMMGQSVSDTIYRTEPKREVDSQVELSSEDSLSEDVTSSVTEGKGQPNTQQTTMVANNNSQSGYVALRTVPVILRNGNRSLKVNAL